jgi:glycine oxidase
VSEFHDCIVVGAGLVGAACARELARAGRRVLLLDRQEPGKEASWAAAGMLAPQIEAATADPMLALALEARDRYGALAAALMKQPGIDVSLNPCGIALVAFEEERERELMASAKSQQAMGLACDWLDQAALRRRHPGVGEEARGALLAPRDGTVDNRELVRAIIADAENAGATLAQEPVSAIDVEHGRVRGVRTESQARRAASVVIAAGAWSGAVSGLPRSLPIEPVRGQMALAPWPGGEPQGVLFGRSAYVVPRRGEALLGSTMERAGFEVRTTAEGIQHIRTETGALLPALLTQAIRRTWAGLRPMTPDHHPIIGADPEVSGLFYATGHGRNGILLGPITGEIIRDLVVRGETHRDLAPYSVMRFERASPQDV